MLVTVNNRLILEIEIVQDLSCHPIFLFNFIILPVFIHSTANAADIQSSVFRNIIFRCRFMFGLAAVPSVIQFVGFLFMPDTPRWLIARGRNDKARAVLHRIHGTSVDIEQEVTEIVNSVQQCAENRKLCTGCG